MTNQEFTDINNLLSSPKDVVILSHRNPDGDAIGSSLALGLMLKKMYHKVTIVVPSEYPEMLDYLFQVEEVKIFDLTPDECRKYVDEAQVIFLLDFNSLDRIDKLGENVLLSKAKKIMIDHHIDPEPIADYILSETEASSTCELIYKFFEGIGKVQMIDPYIGEAIFTGIITDTGSFKYATRPYTYKVAAALKEKGVDDYALQNQIHNSLKEKQIRLLGHCLAHRFEILEGTQTAFIYLTKEDYAQFNIQRGDTEGIVNYLLMIKDVSLAGFITQQPNLIKISLRSKGDINVQDMASKYFNGGGHKNASGGSAYAKLEDIINRFKEVAPNYVSKSF